MQALADHLRISASGLWSSYLENELLNRSALNDLPRYFTPILPDSGSILLDPAEGQHAVRVMRARPGDRIELVDGKGKLALAEVVEISKKECRLRIDSCSMIEETDRPSVSVAFSLLKSFDRIQLILEKCTEIGVREFFPLLTDHSERRKVSDAKMQHTLIGALKQSRRVHLPVLHESDTLEGFLDKQKGGGSLIYLAHCRSGEKRELRKVYDTTRDAVLLIGPEGDFSEKEVELCRKAGCIEVALGGQRLRSETAATYALVTLHALVP